MAAIDKCYVDNYSDYQQFKEWAKDRSFVTPRGNKICISDYIFDLEEKYFNSKSIPIFNTPTYVDNYLYKNCPLKFIQDWLQDRYFRGGYSKGVPDELTQELKLPEYEPCKRVKIIKHGLGNCPFRIYNSYTNKKFGSWWIEVRSTNNRSYWYNNDKDYWLFPDENDVWTSSCCCSKLSVKAIIRKILKVWKLPKNCIITIQGRLINDDWILKTF